MSIGVRRPAVGRPTRVADAERSLRPIEGDQRFEGCDPARRFPDVERLLGDRGDAGRVVSPIFQSTKSADDEGRRVPVADVADDATHCYRCSYAASSWVQSRWTATLRWSKWTETTRTPVFRLPRTRTPSTFA